MRNSNGNAALGQIGPAGGGESVPSAEACRSKDGSGRTGAASGQEVDGAAPVWMDRWTAETCRGTWVAQPPAGQLCEHGAGAHQGDTASDPQHSPLTWDDGEHSSVLAAAHLLGHLCCRDIM